jgi:hypothetical protein
MKLDMTKIYIDSRFRTANSKSESDFNVELPRSFNVPDGVVAHIDDIVIPVSWRTVDERNNKCYISVFSGLNALLDTNFTLTPQNYDGTTFAAELATKLNIALATFVPLPVMTCNYDILSGLLTISMTDARTGTGNLPIYLQILTDDTLAFGSQKVVVPNTINTILGNKHQTLISVAEPYKGFVDLFNTRNLYLTSSALCSYDTVSNFGMDTIVKKIPCTASYNRMIFQSSGSTLDGLDVSKRTLRFLDFKLVDSSFRPIDLQGNHFSFSIVFVQKR